MTPVTQPTQLTPAEFETLAARTGIPFTDAQKTTLREALTNLDRFAALVSRPLPRAAEPALTFSVETRP